MQSCSEARQSGLLVTILNADAKLNYAMKLAREWCQQKEGIEEPVCEVANHLYPHCKVVGGDAKVSDDVTIGATVVWYRNVRHSSVAGVST